jgi:cation-transporting P-type ATPase I
VTFTTRNVHLPVGSEVSAHKENTCPPTRNLFRPSLVSMTERCARVTPVDKVRIVAALQRRGQAVAMTGDGANDAPAIRLADVGIALGAHSTPAARRAADVVVTDERIETIVDAIIEGRAMWSSVREALAILLGGNLGEVVFIVAATAVTGRAPLSARQLRAQTRATK